MERPSSAPESIDRPSAARMHDYLMGGVHNLAVDRDLAAQFAQLMPDLVPHLHANRACLRRMVGFCVEAGIRQFLDLSWGIPIRGNVGDVVQRAAPEARVMHVDIDPVALGPNHKILTSSDRTGVIQADPRQPENILTNPQVRGLLDFDRPMAVILGTLQFVLEGAAGVVAAFRDAVAPGSYLAISHLTAEFRPGQTAEIRQMLERVGVAVRPRSRAEVERLFAGLELVEPGLVWAHEWRPDPPHSPASGLDRPFVLSGVGRKR